MPERPEIWSSARPSALRLWGFLSLVAGALLAGLGAVLDWATVGFPSDEVHALDVAVKGTDVWEGKVVLATAVLALLGILAMRLVLGTDRRRTIAFGIATLGVLAIALALSVAVRAEARLGGGEGLDGMAVDLGAGVWVATAGGLLIDLGGALGLLWIKEQEAQALPTGGSDPGTRPEG